MTADGIDQEQVVRALGEHLMINVAQDEWDQEPDLAIMVRRADTVEFEPMNVPGALWEAAPVHVLLGAMATALRFENPFKMPDVVGVALFVEGWGLLAGLDTEERQAAQEWAETHSIADHPDGVEVKIVTAALTDGATVSLIYHRGGAEADVQDVVEGRIPNALHAVLRAFEG